MTPKPPSPPSAPGSKGGPRPAIPATGSSVTGSSATGSSPSGVSPSGVSPSGVSPSGVSPSGASPSGSSPGASSAGVSYATPSRADAPRPTPPARSALPILAALGFVLLLAGLAYLWQRQEQLMAQPPAVDPAAFAGLQSDVRAAGQRAAPDLRPIEARIAALENRPPPPPPDLKPLDTRIAALENKPAPLPTDLKPLEDRIAALENRPPPQIPDVAGIVGAAVAPLAGRIDGAARDQQTRIDTLARDQQSRIDALTKDMQANQTDLSSKLEVATSRMQDAEREAAGRVDALEKKLAAAEQRATAQSAQGQQALQAQRALTSLESGKPVGDIAGAPPSVAKYATSKPPTEAELRLNFPAAAARATDASRTGSAELPVRQQLLQHAETLFTFRKGNDVVVGTNAAQTLGRAKDRLDAGDLAGAVTALDGLDPGAAQAMADWRAQAQSLLDARAALTAMTLPAKS